MRLVLGQRAENLQDLTAPHAGSLRLADGTAHDFDLIFPVLGARANVGILSTLPGAEPSSAGRVKVDGWLRPSRLPNVFAAGDVVDTGDAMTIVAVSRQLPWLKKTLLGLGKGTSIDQIKPYVPWGKRAPILVPLGPRRGSSFLGIITLGDLPTRLMKGKDLFISKYRSLLGKV